jgi:hypothetical protein
MIEQIIRPKNNKFRAKAYQPILTAGPFPGFYRHHPSRLRVLDVKQIPVIGVSDEANILQPGFGKGRARRTGGCG